MKKIISVILTFVLCFSICSCSKNDDSKLKIAALKGPTSIGLLDLIDNNENIDYTLAGTADEITAPFINGDYDIVSVPCNVASVLYNKLNGDVCVLAVNTLGVLYLIDTENEIASIDDLAGRTVYSTGKGTTPQYVFDYILERNGLTDKVNVEDVSEATELASMLAKKTASLAILPQPYVTVVLEKNENAKIALDLTQEWDKVSENKLVTGVLIAKRSFVNSNKDKTDKFLKDYKKSTEYANTEIEQTAEKCVRYGVISDKEIAKKAIPYCNIVYIDREEMKASVSAYLETLGNTSAIQLPKDDFYYLG